MDKLWYLQQIDLFKDIPDNEIMKLACKVVEKKIPQDELIYTPHEEHNSICVLKKGEVTLYHTHYGKKLIIDTLKPGSIFGSIDFQQGKNNHFAKASTDAHICFFTIQDFLEIIRAKPELMMKLIQIMSQRITAYEKRLKSGLFDAKEKILDHLEQTERKNNSLFCLITGKTHLTHEKISEHVGLSRETVTRAIKGLKKEGIIKTDKQGRLFIAK